jgi:predicted pyridoxine 5'-phosphate oxidase superfamily flavin-nucleotide-binding protein
VETSLLNWRAALGPTQRNPSEVAFAGGRDPLPEAARELSQSDAVAHVVTLDADGGPQVTAAWVGIEGVEIVSAMLPDQRKLRNLRRDPRIALSVPSTTRNECGLLEYLVV